VLIISFVAYNFYYILDPWRQLNEVNSNKCRVKKGIIGAEDIVKVGKFLITAGDDRIKLWEHPAYLFAKTIDGGLYLIDPITENIKQLNLEGFPKDIAFHPHGIYAVNNTIYVINHAYSKGGERVEVFGIKQTNDGDKAGDKAGVTSGDTENKAENPDTQTENKENKDNIIENSFETFEIVYKYSIKFDNIHSGRFNDLAVTESNENNDEFYITSYLAFPDPIKGKDTATNKFSKFKNFAVIGLQLSWSYVYYCKGLTPSGIANCTHIISERSNSVMNNGIEYDAKKNILYVAMTFEKSVRVFKIDENDRSVLHYERDIYLKNNPDNILLDTDTNTLISGVTGKISDLMKFAENSVKNLATEGDKCWCGVERINLDINETEIIVMQNKLICGISSAIQVKNKVFIGSCADEGVLICEI